MALTTFKEMQDYTLRRLGMGETRRADCKDWIDKATEEAEEAWDWPELLTEAFIQTVAEITTGAVTFTNGDATVVSDNPPDFTTVNTVGRKITTGYGSPAFLIDSITDNVNLEMEQTWAFATSTSGSFVIYQDVYSLAADVGTLYPDLVTLHDTTGRILHPMSQSRSIRYTDVPESSGRPDYFWPLGVDSSGNRRIGIGPLAPDKVYVIRYWYKKSHTALSADGDKPALDTDLLEMVCEGAMVRGYQMPEFADTNKAERQEAKYRRMLAEKINRRKPQSSGYVIPRTFDASAPRRRLNINFPVSAD